MQAFLLLTSRHVFLLSSPPLRVMAQHSHETLVHSVTQRRIHNARTTRRLGRRLRLGSNVTPRQHFVVDSLIPHLIASWSKNERLTFSGTKSYGKKFCMVLGVTMQHCAKVSTNACCPPIPQMARRSNDQFRTRCECYARYLR